MAGKYRFSKKHKDIEIVDIQREIEDNLVSYDKNGNLVISKDIHCRSLYVDGDSIYLGDVKLQKPKYSEDGDVLKYDYSGKKIALSSDFASGSHGHDIVFSVVEKSAEYTLTSANNIVLCDGTFSILLPATSYYHLAGKPWWVKNIGTGTITIDADTTGSTTIDGETTQPLGPGESMMIISDLTEYWII